jgi:hypothetical protein
MVVFSAIIMRFFISREDAAECFGIESNIRSGFTDVDLIVRKLNHI